MHTAPWPLRRFQLPSCRMSSAFCCPVEKPVGGLTSNSPSSVRSKRSGAFRMLRYSSSSSLGMLCGRNRTAIDTSCGRRFFTARPRSVASEPNGNCRRLPIEAERLRPQRFDRIEPARADRRVRAEYHSHEHRETDGERNDSEPRNRRGAEQPGNDAVTE